MEGYKMKIELAIFEQTCPKCGKNILYHKVSKTTSKHGFIPPDEHEVPYLMKCDTCGKYAYFMVEDAFFHWICEKLYHKYGTPYNAWTNTTPWRNELFHLFEELVDNCQCGGRFKLMDERCNHCGSFDYDNSWKDGVIKRIQIEANKVTHNKIKSLNDIKDPKLKKIFKDFDFSKVKDYEEYLSKTKIFRSYSDFVKMAPKQIVFDITGKPVGDSKNFDFSNKNNMEVIKMKENNERKEIYSGNLVSDSFIKRAFAVWGHNLVIELIIAVIIGFIASFIMISLLRGVM